MAKTKTYNLAALAKAMRTTSTVTRKRLEREGIKPVSELKSSRYTYRLYNQAAMDIVLQWRAGQDAHRDAVAAVPAESAQPEQQPAVDFTGMLKTLQDARLSDKAEAYNSMQYISRQLDTLTALVNSLASMWDLTPPPQVLNGLAAERPDDSR